MQSLPDQRYMRWKCGRQVSSYDDVLAICHRPSQDIRLSGDGVQRVAQRRCDNFVYGPAGNLRIRLFGGRRSAALLAGRAASHWRMLMGQTRSGDGGLDPCTEPEAPSLFRPRAAHHHEPRVTPAAGQAAHHQQELPLDTPKEQGVCAFRSRGPWHAVPLFFRPHEPFSRASPHRTAPPR